MRSPNAVTPREASIHILTVRDPDGSLVVGDSHRNEAGDRDEILDVRTEA